MSETTIPPTFRYAPQPVAHLDHEITHTDTVVFLMEPWTAETPYLLLESQIEPTLGWVEVMQVVGFDPRQRSYDVIRGVGESHVLAHVRGAFVYAAWPAARAKSGPSLMGRAMLDARRSTT